VGVFPSTYSIVAWDPEAGEWGVAVQSKFLGVGAVVPWARAGVGAVATQAWANVGFGPRGLEMLEDGLPAQQVVEELVAGDEGRGRRQVAVVDGRGRAAAHTGRECPDWAGHVTGDGYSCQGNILVGRETVDAMARAFVEVEGALPERLVAALEAGQAAGGDRRGQQSAALLVVREGGGYGGYTDRYVDLRVEDHPRPIEELARVLKLHRLYFSGGGTARLVRLEPALVREIQDHLRRLGHYSGPATGRLDERTREALQWFYAIENFEERMGDDEHIDADVLEFMREAAEGRGGG